MMKLGAIVLASCLCGSLAAPQNYGQDNQGFAQGRQLNQGGFDNFNNFEQGPFEIIPILRDVRNGPLDGYYDFEFETGNGIYRQEQGEPTAPNGAVVSQGRWTHTFPDGTPADFSFVANEFGYHPESSLLPIGPEIPPHALEQIARSERERAAGIFHDGQYDPQRYGGGQWDPQIHGGGQWDPSRYSK